MQRKCNVKKYVAFTLHLFYDRGALETAGLYLNSKIIFIVQDNMELEETMARLFIFGNLI